MRKIIYTLSILLSFILLTSCEKEEYPTYKPKKNTTQHYLIRVAYVNYDTDSIVYFKNVPDNEKPIITMSGNVAGKYVTAGNSIEFDLKAGESYYLTIKSSKIIWLKVFTYVNYSTYPWTNANHCKGDQYVTFGKNIQSDEQVIQLSNLGCSCDETLYLEDSQILIE